jgi:hypothetical protein
MHTTQSSAAAAAVDEAQDACSNSNRGTQHLLIACAACLERTCSLVTIQPLLLLRLPSLAAP